jgi:amino acid adenylation domain-containing protein
MTNTLAHQQALKARCIHPSGAFVEFTSQEALQSVVKRFERQVHQHPDRLALKTRVHTYTYSELNAAANRVAHALIALRGEGSETVALLFENGAPFVVASLGALKAGKIQVPLDSTFPRARLSYMLQQSGAAVVMTDSRNLPLAQNLGALSVVNIEEIDGRYPPTNVELILSPDAPASIEYTSGSTGEPKGIVRNHRGVMHAVMHHTNTFRIGMHDRLIMSRAGLRTSLYALLNGAAYYPVNLRHEEPRRLAAWLSQQEITIYRAAVSGFRSLASALGGLETFPYLRLIILFGEPVYPTEVDLYRKHFSDSCIFVTSLGCSEFGDYAHFFLDKETSLSDGVLPGGYALRDTSVLLLDDDRCEVAVDQAGEIAIRSSFGAVGYWRRPDLTESSFLSTPDSGDERIYRTGDLGRKASDGCLFHLGRKDFQVKIRGHRVEVSEVETALLALDGLKEAVVVGREDTPGDKRLVAYVVPLEGRVPTVSAMRRLLADKLPDYMVPSLFIRLDTLPLTPTGKVDRRSLPPPGVARPELESPYVAPRSPIEETLVKIWAEVLGLERVGIHDPFLELGGDSILAMVLASRVRAAFQTQVALRTLFESPTVAKLATVIFEILARGIDKERLDQMINEVISDQDLPSSSRKRSPLDEA